MKYFALWVTLFWSVSGIAQIDLAHEFALEDLADNKYFHLVYLDDNEPVYVSMGDESMKIFDMDYNFVQEIDLDIGNPNANVQYISRTLFDCDPDNIEFLVTYPYVPVGGNTSSVQVKRDDGTILLEVESSTTLAYLSFPSNAVQAPVLSTPSGTKLFVFKSDQYIGDGGIQVYDVCGNLPSMCCDAEGSGIGTHTDGVNAVHYSLAMPNPTAGMVTIKLSEPIAGFGAQVMVFNGMGQLVHSTSVNPGQKYIPVDLADQASGTYIYHLTNETGVLESGKVVKQ